MDLEDLRAVQRTARSADTLQDLPESFYRDVAALVDDLEARRDQAAAAADDPWESPEVRRATDEIAAVRNIVQGVFERRVAKVVRHASLRGEDIPDQRGAMTPEERGLHETVHDAIREIERALLADVLPPDEG